MDTKLLQIEKLLDEKILLFRELLSLLEEERTSISERDVPMIWQSSERKNQLVATIREIRQKVFVLAQGSDPGTMPRVFDVSSLVKDINSTYDKEGILEKSRSIRLLKKEIQNRSKENARFVREYLSVYENLLETMLGTTSKDPQIYNRQSVPRKGTGSVYFREV